MLIALAGLMFGQVVTQLDGGTLDAGTPKFSAEVYKLCPVVDETTPPAIITSFTADGGADWLLPHPRGPRMACLLEACETDRALKEDRLKSGKDFAIAFGAGATAATAVVLSFLALERTFRR